MQVFKDDSLAIGWFVTKIHPPTFSMTVVVKMVCPLAPGAMEPMDADDVEITGDAFHDGEGESSLRYPSDVVPFKPNADILLVGSAHAPKNRPAKRLKVGLRVGDLHKMVEVVGARKWESYDGRWRLTEPGPFQSMPLQYEKAFGGPDRSQNPVGIGYGGETEPPNIEHVNDPIRTPDDELPPAGFGPIDAAWTPRKEKTGTYDDQWTAERWPWMPNDFDWTFFNTAPLDQQLEGYLRGDEEIELRNVHPELAAINTRLPGLRPRVFLSRRSDSARVDIRADTPNVESDDWLFREVAVHLDTLWLDADAQEAVLIWRGAAQVRSINVKEVGQVLVIAEPMTEEPKDLAFYRAELQRRLDNAPEEDELEAALAEAEKQLAEAEANKAAAETDSAARKQEALAAGVDPQLLDHPPPSPQSQAKALKAQLIEEHNAMQAAGAPEQDVAMVAANISKMGELLDTLGPEPLTTRDQIEAAVAAGESLAGQRFSELDLSGIDLSNVDGEETLFYNVDLSGAKLTGAKLSAAMFHETNLSNADLRNATLDSASFADCTLDGVQWHGCSLAGAELRDLELPNVDFHDSTGPNADFSGSNLQNGNFAGADFKGSDFSGCKLQNADFSNANLAEATFSGSSARGIRMQSATLTKLRGGDKADFSQASFRHCDGEGSAWQESNFEGADFSGANLVDSVFTETQLNRAVFECAELTGANFCDASLSGANLTSANLLRASFDRADLTEADFQAANMYEAGFWEIVAEKTNFEGANLKNTLLE